MFTTADLAYCKMFTNADLAYQNKMKNKKWLDNKYETFTLSKIFYKKKKMVFHIVTRRE